MFLQPNKPKMNVTSLMGTVLSGLVGIAVFILILPVLGILLAVAFGIVLGGSGQDLLKPISNVLRPAGQLWYGFDGGRLGRPQRFSWREKAKMYYRPSALASVLRGSDRALL